MFSDCFKKEEETVSVAVDAANDHVDPVIESSDEEDERVEIFLTNRDMGIEANESSNQFMVEDDYVWS